MTSNIHISPRSFKVLLHELFNLTFATTVYEKDGCYCDYFSEEEAKVQLKRFAQGPSASEEGF